VTDVPEPTSIHASGDASAGGAPGHALGADLAMAPAATATVAAMPSPARRGARIEVQKLGKSYLHGGKALAILWDIDLALAPGDMVAVVGASGVGKSTFLQLLGTLDLPTSGSIRFDGEELTTMSASRLAEFRNRRIGFVFQFHHLLPEFTALENVMMPLRIGGRDEKTARDKAAELLARVGLSARMHHRPGELSGGEQQRTAVARALAMDPKVILADEPSGNLDLANAENLHELLEEVVNDLEIGMIVVTHNRALAARAGRVLLLEGGRLSQTVVGDVVV
jgi:lipoprotein-releasing system ATP-binding protein